MCFFFLFLFLLLFYILSVYCVVLLIWCSSETTTTATSTALIQNVLQTCEKKMRLLPFPSIKLIWVHRFGSSQFVRARNENVCMICSACWLFFCLFVHSVLFFVLSFSRPINYIIPRINNSDKRNTEAFDNVSILQITNLINILQNLNHAIYRDPEQYMYIYICITITMHRLIPTHTAL